MEHPASRHAAEAVRSRLRVYAYTNLGWALFCAVASMSFPLRHAAAGAPRTSRAQAEAALPSVGGFWDRYEWPIIAGVAALGALEVLLVGALLINRQRRMRADAERRAGEIRLRALLKAQPDLMFVQTRDGVYEDYHAKNPADLLVPPEQFLGKRMADVLPPDLATMFRRCLDEAMATGGPIVAEYSLTIAGEERHFEARMVRGDDQRVVSIVRDITDRKRVAELLRKSEEFNRRIVEHSTECIKVLDLDGRLKWMNETGLRLLDLEEFSIENQPIEDFFTGAERASAIEAVRAARSGGTGTFHGFSRTTKGRPKWWDVAITPMTNAAGQVESLLAVSRDVTERRNAEEALREAQSELSRVSRLMTAGALTSSIAHEVGQPLTALLVNAQAFQRLLANDTADITALREVVRDIVQEARRASDIIMHVRTLFTKTPPQTASLDLNELVEDVLDLVRRDINRAGIALQADLQPDLPQVVGDRVQLQQVLLNLLRNAVEAMSHEQGSLRIVAVKTTSLGADSVEVSVIDSGQGFRAGDEERIFDPFYTTKVDGMGLGLAMCRMIIRAHGGQLWATSNKGSGSTFRFALSAAGREAKARLVPEVAKYLSDRRHDEGATLGGSPAVPGR